MYGGVRILSNYKCLKKDPEYLKLLVANFISCFGTSIDNIAFSWMVYQLTGDPVWIAIIFGASMLPMILLQPLVGVLVERLNKKTVMIFSDALGAILMLIVAILYVTNLLNPVLLLIITLLNASIESIRMPAGISFVPRILSKENYEVGVGLSKATSQIASLLGLSVTGVIIGVWGIHIALIIDAITFVISFVILLFIKYGEIIQKTFKDEKFTFNIFKTELKEGFCYLYSKKQVWFVCLYGAFLNLLSTAMNTYNAIYIGDYLNLGATAYSAVSVVFTVGLILGGFISPYILKKFTLMKIMLCSGVTQGLFYFIWFGVQFFNNSIFILPIILVSTFLYALVNSCVGVSLGVVFMKSIESDYQARAGSIFNAIASCASPFGSIILAIISYFIGIDIIFIIFGIISVIIAMIFYFNKEIRNS